MSSDGDLRKSQGEIALTTVTSTAALTSVALALAAAGFAVAPAKWDGKGARRYKELQSPHVPPGGHMVGANLADIDRLFARFSCADAIAARDLEGRHWDVFESKIRPHTTLIMGEGEVYAERQPLSSPSQSKADQPSQYTEVPLPASAAQRALKLCKEELLQATQLRDAAQVELQILRERAAATRSERDLLAARIQDAHDAALIDGLDAPEQAPDERRLDRLDATLKAFSRDEAIHHRRVEALREAMNRKQAAWNAAALRVICSTKEKLASEIKKALSDLESLAQRLVGAEHAQQELVGTAFEFKGGDVPAFWNAEMVVFTLVGAIPARLRPDALTKERLLLGASAAKLAIIKQVKEI